MQGGGDSTTLPLDESFSNRRIGCRGTVPGSPDINALVFIFEVINLSYQYYLRTQIEEECRNIETNTPPESFKSYDVPYSKVFYEGGHAMISMSILVYVQLKTESLKFL